jgi:uncharacterized protein with ParB-like and HNH nuclease domain
VAATGGEQVSKSINSEDLSIAKVFQSFYRVPDYQREYVWGEKGAKGEGGDEVEQFLHDIHSEFEAATAQDAPEYFIGTIVVCEGENGIFDLIDGQQRTTTSFLTLCALRDALVELGAEVPSTLKSEIADSSTDWQGTTVHRLRLDLQYEDAGGVLTEYAEGEGRSATREGTRSIRNLANAYDAIREFLQEELDGDPEQLRRFYGYFANKVKLIRIQTPSVSRALKIFETINDRGVGLDAMDLLKNLLFMNAKPEQFAKLKAEWKELTQELYSAGEKPLRFLRYFILASFEVKESKLREEEIYDWLTKANDQTNHVADPLGFATRLKKAAQDYACFSKGQNPAGKIEHGLLNTRAVGGSAIRQHYVLLLAGRHLQSEKFAQLCDGIEQLMAVWLFAGVPSKDYERAIIAAAKTLRTVKSDEDFQAFVHSFFDAEKKANAQKFAEALSTLSTWDVRQFRMKYLLAKVAQYFDTEAYGPQGREALSTYLASGNEVEHILAQGANAEAVAEFGDGADDPMLAQKLGNLMLLEKSVNIVASNEPYSKKCVVYPSSVFLVSRCQKEPLQVGVNDRITRAIKRLDPAPDWTREAIERRQKWFADVALDVWQIREPATISLADALIPEVDDG